jgi:uncharacterized YigZ family protein
VNGEKIGTADYYLTIASPASAENKVKGSVFIGAIGPAENSEAAERFVEGIRKNHHDATHNCFAYRINQNNFRYSDDGEPSGTAGRPILTMIDKHQLTEVALVVTRYFGGTKLGTGGLIRAYGECADAAIKTARIVRRTIYSSVELAYPFEMINKVQHLVHKYKGIINENGTAEGMTANIQIAASRLEDFKKELTTQTAGKVYFL